MLLRSAELQKLFRWLTVKKDFTPSQKDKNFLSSRIDIKYRSRNDAEKSKNYILSKEKENFGYFFLISSEHVRTFFTLSGLEKCNYR